MHMHRLHVFDGLKKPAATHTTFQNKRVKCCSTCQVAKSAGLVQQVWTTSRINRHVSSSGDQKRCPPKASRSGSYYVPACGPGAAGPQPCPPADPGAYSRCSAQCRKLRPAAALWAEAHTSHQAGDRSLPLPCIENPCTPSTVCSAAHRQPTRTAEPLQAGVPLPARYDTRRIALPVLGVWALRCTLRLS